jgi:hypothetical protein
MLEQKLEAETLAQPPAELVHYEYYKILLYYYT